MNPRPTDLSDFERRAILLAMGRHRPHLVKLAASADVKQWDALARKIADGTPGADGCYRIHQKPS